MPGEATPTPMQQQPQQRPAPQPSAADLFGGKPNVIRSLPPAEPKASGSAGTRYQLPLPKPKGDSDGMMVMTNATKGLVLGGLMLMLIGIFALISFMKHRASVAEDARLGINRAEVSRDTAIVRELAMGLVTKHLGVHDVPTFVEKRRDASHVDFITGRKKYYCAHGHVLAVNGGSERSMHSYQVDIRFDDTTAQGYVVHLVKVGFNKLHNNPYYDPREK